MQKTSLRISLAAAAMAVLQAGAAAAAPLPPLTPLADPELFISPCGQPFRSEVGQPYPVVAWFKAADTNKDGRIDRAEFRASCEAFFHALDHNGDGAVNDLEIDAYERDQVPEISNAIDSADATGGGGGDSVSTKLKEDAGGPQGAASFSLLNDPEPVRSADRRLAGRITLADFLARADHNFDALDPAGRGYLTLDDLPQTPVQKLARKAARK